MNRRQWIFISLLLAAALTSFAQEASDFYRPFVEEGKVWMVTEGNDRTYIYFFEGDTVIANHHCQKLFQRIVGQDEKNALLDYMGAFYEEEHRVWFFYQEQQPGAYIHPDACDPRPLLEPRLLYDFRAKKGERLEVWQPSHAGIQVKYGVEITDTRSVESSGIPFNCISFRCDSHDYGVSSLGPSLNFWMEGIGSPVGPLFHTWGNYLPSPVLSLVERCSVQDSCIYELQNLPAFALSEAIQDHISAQPSSVSASSPALFDLSGRRLSAPPAKGIYIENGQKRVARGKE